MTPVHVIRLASQADLGGFMELARLAAPGFTSLPVNENKLAAMLAQCRLAAAGASGVIMLALEDVETGCIAGCAAVKRGGAPRPGFGNFRVAYDRADVPRALTVCDDYSDLTEIGGLFLHPDYRSQGVGRWLAQSRYLLVAAGAERFGATLFAELRGVIHEGGVSPFYDAACAPWLGMPFCEADTLSSAGENERLVAMFPKGPISTETFPPDAKRAIGECHASGAGARAMLEKEGFRFNGVVDLLDGGALVTAQTGAISTIRQSRLARVKFSDQFAAAGIALLATTHSSHFRCTGALAALAGNYVLCDRADGARLGVKEGDVIRVSPLAGANTGANAPALEDNAISRQ